MDKKFLDADGLQIVADNTNRRLKTVTEMPLTASNNAIRLYVGETTSTYTKGHAYQIQSGIWTDITQTDEIDTSFNPVSDNAQSGVAISQAFKQAINNVTDVDTWEPVTWYGLTNFYGSNIWHDGDTIYYSSGSEQYVLNKATSTWEEKTWYGLTDFDPQYVWSDGTDVYYSNYSTQYVLNRATDTWEEKTWYGWPQVNGLYIWKDGDDVYYSDYLTQKVLNKATSTWETKIWVNNDYLRGNFVWTSDGTDIYFTNSNTYNSYKLNRQNNTWENSNWDIRISSRTYIWSDGCAAYYSFGTNQYVLDKTTNTWKPKTWSGSPNYNAYCVWHDGTNIYLSFATNHYKLADRVIK